MVILCIMLVILNPWAATLLLFISFIWIFEKWAVDQDLNFLGYRHQKVLSPELTSTWFPSASTQTSESSKSRVNFHMISQCFHTNQHPFHITSTCYTEGLHVSYMEVAPHTATSMYFPMLPHSFRMFHATSTCRVEYSAMGSFSNRNKSRKLSLKKSDGQSGFWSNNIKLPFMNVTDGLNLEHFTKPWPYYRIWPFTELREESIEYLWRCSMLISEANSSGHLVPSNLTIAYALLV